MDLADVSFADASGIELLKEPEAQLRGAERAGLSAVAQRYRFRRDGVCFLRGGAGELRANERGEQCAVLASLDRNGKGSAADLYDDDQVPEGMIPRDIRQAADELAAMGLVTFEDVVQQRYFTITDAGRAALIHASQ